VESVVVMVVESVVVVMMENVRMVMVVSEDELIDAELWN